MGRETAHGHARRAGDLLRLVKQFESRAADDEADQLVGIGLDGRFLAHDAAVAHDDHSIGDAEYLVEPVRDIDHADAAALEPSNRVEQALDLVRRKACGRFVQHEEVAVDDERPRDGDKRFLGTAEAPHAAARIDLAADQRQRFPRALLGFRPIDEAECA